MPHFGVTMRKRWERCRRLWPEVLFIGGLYGGLLLLFSLLRGVLLWRNALSAGQVAPFLLVRSFLIGARFDLAVISYLLIPLLLLLLFRRRQRIWLAGFHLLVGLLLLLGVAEAEFYRMFATRFDAQVFLGLRYPLALCRRVWQTCPVAGYLLLWGGMLAILLLGSGWLQRRLLRPWPARKEPRDALLHIMGTAVTLALMVVLSRGGFGYQPLSEEDAVFCQATFANDLALNGLFVLGCGVWHAWKKPPAPLTMVSQDVYSSIPNVAGRPKGCLSATDGDHIGSQVRCGASSDLFNGEKPDTEGRAAGMTKTICSGPGFFSCRRGVKP